MPFETFEKCVRALCDRNGLYIWEIKNSRGKYDENRGQYTARLNNGYTIYGNSIAQSVELRHHNHRFYASLAELQAAM